MESNGKSNIDPYYLSGEFLKKSDTGDVGGGFKVDQMRKILDANIDNLKIDVNRVVDIGCGTGRTTFLLRDMLVKSGYGDAVVHGYDIHPDMDKLSGDDTVSFFAEDFTQIQVTDVYDIGVLFDVIEHIPDPITFIRGVAQRCKVLIFHVPLDNSFINRVRNLSKNKLSHPGHLVMLDVPTTINLLTFAGLRIRDFQYSPTFRHPIERVSLPGKVLYPIRELLFRINPYLSQSILGGNSLMVITHTPVGLQAFG